MRTATTIWMKMKRMTWKIWKTTQRRTTRKRSSAAGELAKEVTMKPAKAECSEGRLGPTARGTGPKMR
jgi:hypothetical protein